MNASLSRFTLLGLLTITLVGLGSAQWEWEPTKYNLDYASPDSNQIYSAQLYGTSDDGDTVMLTPDNISFYPDNINDIDYVNYTYGEDRNSQSLNYSEDLRFWYADLSEFKKRLHFSARGTQDGLSNSEGGINRYLTPMTPTPSYPLEYHGFLEEDETIKGNLNINFDSFSEEYNVDETPRIGVSLSKPGENIEQEHQFRANLSVYNHSYIKSYGEADIKDPSYWLDINLSDLNAGSDYIFKVNGILSENIKSSRGKYSKHNLDSEGINFVDFNDFGLGGATLSGSGKSVHAWNLTSGSPNLKVNYTGHEGTVEGAEDLWQLENTPTGPRLNNDLKASFSGNEIHIWNKTEANSEKGLSSSQYRFEHSSSIKFIEYGFAGMIASSAGDKIQFWNYSGKSDGLIEETKFNYTGHNQEIKGLKFWNGNAYSFTDESIHIYSADSEGTVEEPSNTFENHEGSIEDLEIYYENIMASTGDKVILWNTTNKEVLGEYDGFSDDIRQTKLLDRRSHNSYIYGSIYEDSDKIDIWLYRDGMTMHLMNYTAHSQKPLKLGWVNSVSNPKVIGSYSNAEIQYWNLTNIYRGGTSEIVEIRPDSTSSFFDINDSLEFDVSKIDTVNKSFNISNEHDRAIELEYSLDENLSDVFSGFENDSVMSGEEIKKNVTVNLSDYEDIDGILNVSANVTDNVKSVDVEVETEDCELINGSICSDENSLVFDRTDSSITDSFNLYNLNKEENQFNFSVSGNISSHIDINESYNFTSYREIPVIYSPLSSGNHTGNLTITSDGDEINISLEGESNATTENPEILVNPTYSNPLLVEGENGTGADVEVTVENTGNVNIDSINATSPSKSIDIEAFSLDANNSQSFAIPVSNADPAFDVEFSANENVSTTVTIEPNYIENYAERTSELRDTINELQGMVEEGSETSQELTNIKTNQLSTIETQWENQNYLEAQNTYEEIDSDLAEIRNEIDSGDPGDEPEPEPPGNSGGGGGLIIILLVLMVLFGVGGFVFYESYIPEEGDPLYGVMGE